MGCDKKSALLETHYCDPVDWFSRFLLSLCRGTRRIQKYQELAGTRRIPHFLAGRRSHFLAWWLHGQIRRLICFALFRVGAVPPCCALIYCVVPVASTVWQKIVKDDVLFSHGYLHDSVQLQVFGW